MINHQEVKKEIIDFIGEKNIKMFINFYNEKKNIFPVIVEDGILINVNNLIGENIRNYINDKFNIVPYEINNWTTYEDYIYNLMVEIVKEYENKYKLVAR